MSMQMAEEQLKGIVAEKVEGDAVSKEELWKVVSELWTMHGPGWDEMYEDEDEDEADASV